MSEIDFLLVEDLLQFTRDLGAGPVRDVGLLEAAAARPRTTVFGDDAYPTLDLKAAALMHSICGNHALVDGNKRLAWLATLVFLDINGVSVSLAHDEAFTLVMCVADDLDDLDEIAATLRGDERPTSS